MGEIPHHKRVENMQQLMKKIVKGVGSVKKSSLTRHVWEHVGTGPASQKKYLNLLIEDGIVKIDGDFVVWVEDKKIEEPIDPVSDEQAEDEADEVLSCGREV